MASGVNFKIKTHKAKTLSMELPIRYTLAELAAAETATPGNLVNIIGDIDPILAAFQGANKVQDGEFSGWGIGFSTPISSAVPTIQTHEERVALTFECQFPSSTTELHKYSVPTPDILVDWPFPAGQDRVYAADIAFNFSVHAQALISAMQAYLLAWGYDGVTSVTFLYADLVGKNS